MTKFLEGGEDVATQNFKINNTGTKCYFFYIFSSRLFFNNYEKNFRNFWLLNLIFAIYVALIAIIFVKIISHASEPNLHVVLL